jgi:hypothetical protein
MPIKLSEEQRQALAGCPEIPLKVIDELTETVYVLIRADLYEKQAAGGEFDSFDPRETYPFVEEVMRADDANDAVLNSYQDT